jgi:hypothetical protein
MDALAGAWEIEAKQLQAGSVKMVGNRGCVQEAKAQVFWRCAAEVRKVMLTSGRRRTNLAVPMGR